jgi:hypothetical protein
MVRLVVGRYTFNKPNSAWIGASRVKAPIDPAPDDSIVIFVTETSSIRQGIDEHGPSEALRRTVGQLRDDYRRTVSQLLSITQDTPSDDTMKLKSVEVGLGFNAEGELGFIAKAKAGIEVTISLTFERS